MKPEVNKDVLNGLLASLNSYFEIEDIQAQAQKIGVIWDANPFDSATELIELATATRDLLDEIVDVAQAGLDEFSDMAEEERNAYIIEAGAKYFDDIFSWGGGIQGGLMELADYHLGKMLMTFAVGWRVGADDPDVPA